MYQQYEQGDVDNVEFWRQIMMSSSAISFTAAASVMIDISTLGPIPTNVDPVCDLTYIQSYLTFRSLSLFCFW